MVYYDFFDIIIDMRIDCYNFIFHPFDERHSAPEAALSLITNIALAALTLGAYLLVFAAVRTFETPATGSLLPTSMPQIRTFQLQDSFPFDQDVAVIDQMGRNRFVGVENLKKKHANHLAKLQARASIGDWIVLQTHTGDPVSGFDWWMFPVNRSSFGQGEKYHLTQEAVAELKKDEAFMVNYCNGVKLVARSWGWDLENRSVVNDSKLSWQKWTIRLDKMIASTALFGETKLCDSLRVYRLQLESLGLV